MVKPTRPSLRDRIKRSGRARYLDFLRRFRAAKKRIVSDFTLRALKARFWLQIRQRNALILGSNWIATTAGLLLAVMFAVCYRRRHSAALRQARFIWRVQALSVPRSR